MIDDLVELQEKLIPYTGLLNEDIDLPTLKDKSLFTILEWQHELFAVKYFGEVGRTPYTQNIFGIFL